jgi:hypothetical protein
MSLTHDIHGRDFGTGDLALGGCLVAIEQARSGEDHSACTHTRHHSPRRIATHESQRFRTFALRHPTRTPCGDQRIRRRAVAETIIGDHPQAIRHFDLAGLGRDGEHRDFWCDAARHREHAVGCQVHRLDTVVNENSESHVDWVFPAGHTR